MASARLFIRNDDVWTLDREFRFFFDLAIEQGIPVVHAVIPGKMDQKLIRFLCRAKEKTPQLLDIVQHGWRHTNHAVGSIAKYEFGPLRPLESQSEDIRQGLKAMRKAFGEYFTPAFVPPYHGYDSCTLQALYKEDFKIFSAGTPRTGAIHQFLQVPAQISFSRYDNKGPTSIHCAKDVIGSLAKGINRRVLSGVLTHHKDFKSVASRKELTRFFEFIKLLTKKKEWQILLFSDLWRK